MSGQTGARLRLPQARPLKMSGGREKLQATLVRVGCELGSASFSSKFSSNSSIYVASALWFQRLKLGSCGKNTFFEKFSPDAEPRRIANWPMNTGRIS
jgi:hypothetical protein